MMRRATHIIHDCKSDKKRQHNVKSSFDFTRGDEGHPKAYLCLFASIEYKLTNKYSTAHSNTCVSLLLHQIKSCAWTNVHVKHCTIFKCCNKQTNIKKNKFEAVNNNFTFSLLHHGPWLSECKTLHCLIALAYRPLFCHPMTLTMNKVHQHTTVKGMALLPGCLSTPWCPVWCCGDK